MLPADLLGRRYELRVLEDLLASIRSGNGRGLVVYGEPGIGKTALLERAVEMAIDFAVLRTAGNEAEMELPYAGLQDLLRHEGRTIAELPTPQRAALEVALGRVPGDAPDQLLVGLGLLNLLSGPRSKHPLLCVVDDAQWLDAASARAISFAARHVSRDSVGFLIGTRGLTNEIGGIPDLMIVGLGDQDARELLARTVPDRLDDRVVDRLIAETHGNPLALVELPRGLTSSQLAGGFGLPGSVTVAERIEESYRRRIDQLPRESASLLLIAAADPTGDPHLIWRAAESLGIAEEAADAAEADGLVEFGTHVVFSHPLVRSAVYGTAAPGLRREAHRALADATDAGDPDRKAWHLSQATVRPSEAVAAELQRSAVRAQARGGFAAAAAFLERSVELSRDPSRRSARALQAAQAKRQAGALEAASRLAGIAEQGPLSDLERAQLDALVGQIAFARHRGSEVAPRLLKAAARLEHIDQSRARDTYFDALIAAIFAGHLAVGLGAQAVARVALDARKPDRPARASELLLDGLALLVTDGYRQAVPTLKTALTAFHADEVSVEDRLRWSWIAGGTAGLIWDHESWDILTARQERLARDIGALSILPITLSTRVGVCMFAGEAAEARFLAEQAKVVMDASENEQLPNAALLVATFSGDDEEAHRLVAAVLEDSEARGEGLAVTMALWARAVVANAAGNYEEAFRAARAAVQDPNDIWYWGWATVELIEAASRTGRAADAKLHLNRLIDATDAGAAPWGLAVQARCRALVADGEHVEALFEQALKHLKPTRLRFEMARTRLLYGEWLRREHRIRDARTQLREAHALFVTFGMMGFARRAEAELLATGEKTRSPSVGTSYELTPQESRIAGLAARGSTNQDIAEHLFISQATVEYHLSKVYRKLGVKTRTQLANVLRPQD